LESLNTSEPCAFLSDRRESNVVCEVFQTVQPPGESQVFQEAVLIAVPNAAVLSWERVLELRRHPYLEQFRRKITELNKSLHINDTTAIREAVQQVELHDLRALARLVEPSQKTTILKSIVSNIPLPIPVNPVSIGIGLKEIRDTYEKRQKFGNHARKSNHFLSLKKHCTQDWQSSFVGFNYVAVSTGGCLDRAVRVEYTNNRCPIFRPLSHCFRPLDRSCIIALIAA
jgi:hypothetical protein